MTNNIVNCCENASSALPNDNAGDHHHQQQQHQKASMNRNQQQQQQQHPNNHLPNGNTMNSAQQPNHTQHQSNEHLVQTYPNHHHHHHHHLDEKRNDDNFDSRSPYQSTTIANDNNMKTKSPFSSSLVQPTSFSSSSSSSSSSSPPPPYHNDVDDDDDDDDGLRRPKHFNRMSCPDSDSFWNKIHMILVVVASATINGVVFGVVNNFGVFYAHLTEMAAKDPSVLGLNYHGADVDFSPPPPLSSSSTSSSSSSSRINNSYANDNTILNKTIDSSVTNSDALAQSLIAGVGSFNVGLIFFCSIFASVLSDRYDIRKVCLFGGILATIGMYASSVSLNLIYLYITYGLVMGIGASLVYGPSLAILGHYFTKRLGLVNGLVTAGSSAFSIVMPFVLRWLLDKVDIQVTFKYLSILMATLILCSSSFKEQIKRPNKQKHGSAKKNLANMFFYDALWKNNLYLYWVISIPVGLFGYFVPFCHLYKHARDINSYYQGEVLVMSIGVTSMLGRLITGPLADVSRVNRICLQQIAFATIGLLTMCLPFVNDLSLLMVCCGLGLFDGCFISLLGPIAFDLVGPEYANQAIGLLLCFCSLPLTTGPPIAAYSYGIYGDYKLAFVLAGIPPIVAALLMFNIIRMQRMQRRRTSTVKLGIDEPRCLFDEVMIGDCCSNNSGNNGGMEANGKQSQQSRLENSLINGEKLHLLITGNEPNHPNHHKQHPQHAKGINGTTKLTLSPPSSSCNDTDSNSNTIEDSLNGFNDEDDTIQNHPNDNEKTGLLFNDGDGGNNIVILSKDHHQPQPQQQQPQPQSQNNSSSANNNDDNSQSLQSSIRA